MEIEDKEKGVIDPLPNERLMPYTKPLVELQDRPNRRYRRICDRIPGTGDGSNRIIATLCNEIERFRNDSVSITHEGLREVIGSGWSGDMGVLSLLRRSMASGASCLLRKRATETTAVDN